MKLMMSAEECKGGLTCVSLEPAHPVDNQGVHGDLYRYVDDLNTSLQMSMTACDHWQQSTSLLQMAYTC